RRLVLARVPGAAQHLKGVYARLSRAMVLRCRPGTVPVRGGPGSATHRFAALALHRIRDTQASDAFGALFTCQTAHLVPATQFCGVCIVASLTRIEGWAERRSATRTSSRRPKLPQATSKA